MFLIDVPPPTISGLLHMGHVFSYTHMDFMARYASLKQKMVYPFCFDCNGIPTANLAHKNKIDQDKIIDFAIETSKDYEQLFSGMRINWSDHKYHTYDDMAVKIANLSFQDLQSKNLIYRAETEFLFCPKTKVAVTQSEVDENGIYERSGEKIITQKGIGWFIKIKEQLPAIRQAIDSIEWKPDYFKTRLHNWLDGIQYDWSISRDRKFGIPIPGDDLVFDTWFTSSLTPQMAWASHTKEASLQCPIFDIRFQGHDIIRTWALFTIIKSLYHNNQIPWKTIIISGHALDSKGLKISKSVGNYVPPHTYINQYGADGVRYWAAQNQLGTDTKTDTQLMDKGKKLANKIRNASRFLHLNANTNGIDKDFEAEWQKTESNLQEMMNNHNWPDSIKMLTEFFWNRFCDVMIEQSKTRPIFDSMRSIFSKISIWFAIFMPNIIQEINSKG